jgi:23S rRNA (uracil1939-C5)-methyltransferase
LSEKACRLASLLQTADLALPELHLHPSPPLAYRNRIRLTLAEVDGRLCAGYLASAQPEPSNRKTRASNLAFLPITECPIAAPILWRTTEAFLALIDESSTAWLRNPHCKLDQLELFTTADESRLQLTLYLRTAMKALPRKLAADFTALCNDLRTCVPELTGAGIALLPPISTQRSRRVEQTRPGPTWGIPGLNYTVSSLQPITDNLQPATSYWVPRDAFFQVNRFLLPELLALVTDNRSGSLAFDLYAGVGLFSRALATQFTQITAVEIAEPAFTALVSTKVINLHAVRATTLAFLRTAVLQRDRPNLIVLDPPRSGAGAEVGTLLARIAAPTLIYVSCSPETLPADLIPLSASGYRIAELHLFDLFPQTTHIETVTVLSR